MDVISYNTLLFNVHDLVLLLSVALNLILASAFVFFAYRDSNKSYLLLATILSLFAAQSLNTLMIWSPPLRHLILNWQPSLFFWGGLGFWLQGPLLFLLVGKVIDPTFRFKQLYYLHFIPVIAVACLLIFNYHALPQEIQMTKMRNLSFLGSAVFEHLTTLRYLSMLGYAGFCLTTLTYREKYIATQGAYNTKLYSLLKLGIWCVMMMAVWPLLVHLTANRIPFYIANIMGLTSNYLSFVFASIFMFMALISAHYAYPMKATSDDILKVGNEKEEELARADTSSNEGQRQGNNELIKRLEYYMTYEKPFLKCNINLEMLSSQLALPERTLSRVINQHFQQNVVEFINSYRIDEAKKLLIADINNEKPMLTIMEESGFNSKSTFNSTFKQQVGMTPSQFRKTSR